MDLSIIIVTWNSKEFVKSCLDSILASLSGLDAEIILVDNSSSDRTVKIVEENFPGVILIENSDNLGYAKANNQGIAKSQGRYLLLLNPDTLVPRESLDLMIKFMEASPEAGALGPRLVNPDGSVQPSCREFPGFSTLLWEFSGLSRLFPRNRIFGRWRMGYFAFDQPREVDQPMGSCLMLRSEVLKQVGLFDEGFSMFFNDVDLCHRMKSAGWKIFFYPNAQVMHHRGASTGRAKRKMIWMSHFAFYRFLKKHKTGLANRVLLFLLLIPLFLFALPRMVVKR